MKEKYINPYDLIIEKMKEENISQQNLAKILNFKQNELKDFLYGDKKITENIAERLEICFNIPTKIWLKLENEYRQRKQIEYIIEVIFACVLMFGVIVLCYKIFPPILKNKMLIVNFFLYFIFMILNIIEDILILKNLKQNT